jgi:hypothetical protein
MDNRQQHPASARKHRRIVLRTITNKRPIDTGLTTASEASEISGDESLKRQLSSIVQGQEDVNNSKRLRPASSMSPLPNTYAPVSPVSPDSRLTSSPVVQLKRLEESRASASPVPALFENESPESEPELEHVVSEKKRMQGRRLSEYMKELRAKGGVKKPIRKSKRAGLIFPVSRFLEKMKRLMPKFRILENSAVFLTGVVEYLTAELLQISGKA